MRRGQTCATIFSSAQNLELVLVQKFSSKLDSSSSKFSSRIPKVKLEIRFFKPRFQMIWNPFIFWHEILKKFAQARYARLRTDP